MISTIAKPPAVNVEPVKTTTSLEEWEAKTTLTDIETKSVAQLQKACEEREIPEQIQPVGAQVPPFSAGRKLISGNLSRPSSPASSAGVGKTRSQSMYPEKPIYTTQEFYEWFALIESSVVHSQEASYRDHLAKVEGHLQKCDDLKTDLDAVFSDIDDMLDGWRVVEAGGRSLKEACEQLLAERDSLIDVSEEISARLEYFQELEHATRLLNHPGESLVLESDFIDMIERVDICIEFLREHRQYREAEIYLLRFQQCLTRAMTLIKIYFAGALRALTTDITKRMSEKDISQTAQMHLLYTRFQSISSRVGPLLAELERRSSAHPEQLTSLLAECHASYFSARRSLVSAKVAEEIKGLDPGGADLVELTQSGCSYLKQLCTDEFSLYKNFFNSGKDMLYAYLENLCDYLYDDLRPRILHEPRLSVLCAVCRVLQALMVLNVPDAESSSDEDEDEVEDGSATSGGLGQLHISHMLQSVLQDAQTRLFFKAQTVVQTEIRYYVPKPTDLDYPRILEVGVSAHITPTTTSGQDGAFNQISQIVNQDAWYPTLEKTVEVLSQLRDFVQPAIFEDIAREAIDFCRLSLGPAASSLANRKVTNENVDSITLSIERPDLHAHLFLVRHLLLLKQLGAVLNLNAKNEIEVGFEMGRVADLLRTTSLLAYPLSSISKTQEAQAPNAREGIDTDLKRACEGIITLSAQQLLIPIEEFMRPQDSSASHRSTGSAGNTTNSVPSAKVAPTRSSALASESAFRENLRVSVPQMIRRLRLYLGSDEKSNDRTGGSVREKGTISVLLSHIQERVVDAYIAFRKAVEFIPADTDEERRDSDESTRGFASPDEIRSFFS